MEVLKDGAIVARYKARNVPKGEPQVNTNLKIAFGEVSPLKGLGVEDTLQQIGTRVSDVLLTSKARFDGKL